MGKNLKDSPIDDLSESEEEMKNKREYSALWDDIFFGIALVLRKKDSGVQEKGKAG